MAEPFYVLFRDGAPDDWSRAAQVLDLASPTLQRGDATRACRFGFGLVPAPLPEAEALRVAGALDRAGFPAVVLPERSLVRAPAPFVLTNADALPDGLRIQVDLKGTLQTLPWPSLRLVLVECVRPRGLSVSRLPVCTGPRVGAGGRLSVASSLAAGVGVLGDILTAESSGDCWMAGWESDYRVASHGSMHAPEPEPPQPLPPEVWLELFALKPLLRLRIRQSAFNYDYLGERLTTSSRMNFAFLLRDILKFAPGAAKVGQIGPALVGLSMDHPKKIVLESDHERAVTALLTREAIVGLPR